MEENNKKPSIWTTYDKNRKWTPDLIIIFFLVIVIGFSNPIAQALHITTNQGLNIFHGLLVLCLALIMWWGLKRRGEKIKLVNFFGVAVVAFILFDRPIFKAIDSIPQGNNIVLGLLSVFCLLGIFWPFKMQEKRTIVMLRIVWVIMLVVVIYGILLVNNFLF